jgi:hypothetical protein
MMSHGPTSGESLRLPPASTASRALAACAYGARIAACVTVVVMVFAVGVSVARKFDDRYLEASIVREDTRNHCPIGVTTIWANALDEQC